MSLRGQLSHFGVADVLQLLAGQGKTGIARFSRPAEETAFVLEEGAIVSTWDRAATPVDPLKTYILRSGVLPESQVLKALRLESRSELPFAQILLREGMMDLPDLSRHLREQIREEIRRVLAWEDGRFEFIPNPVVRSYGPGCSVRVESVLLQAAHEVDEGTERKATEAPAVVSPPPPPPVAPPERAPFGGYHYAVLLLLPLVAWALSGFLAPPDRAGEERPLLGERVASFSGEREIRNLRLVLEMYRALHDRYPASLVDLVDAGLLSPEQVRDLRNHDVRYRALRGGVHYVLHSGGYGPLVRLLPEPREVPDARGAAPSRAADLRRSFSTP
jgi:hypothetical protein